MGPGRILFQSAESAGGHGSCCSRLTTPVGSVTPGRQRDTETRTCWTCPQAHVPRLLEPLLLWPRVRVSGLTGAISPPGHVWEHVSCRDPDCPVRTQSTGHFELPERRSLDMRGGRSAQDCPLCPPLPTFLEWTHLPCSYLPALLFPQQPQLRSPGRILPRARSLSAQGPLPW